MLVYLLCVSGVVTVRHEWEEALAHFGLAMSSERPFRKWSTSVVWSFHKIMAGQATPPNNQWLISP